MISLTLNKLCTFPENTEIYWCSNPNAPPPPPQTYLRILKKPIICSFFLCHQFMSFSCGTIL